MEVVQRYIREPFDRLSKKSMDLVVKAHEKSGKKSPLGQVAYRYFLDVVLARPALALIDSRERLDMLKAIGVTEGLMATAILAHIILDHTLPNVVIAAIAFPTISQFTDMPFAYTGVAAFVSGRILYGSTVGLAREIMYAGIGRIGRPLITS